jgi:hypothetical protein
MNTPTGSEYMALLEKLRYIQSVTGVQVELPAGGLDEEDVQDIREMYQVITEGSIQFNQREMTLEFTRQTMKQILEAAQRGQGVTYTSSGGEGLITLLDTDVPLGPADINISFVPLASEAELQQILRRMKAKDVYTLNVRVVTGYAIYPKWLRK